MTKPGILRGFLDFLQMRCVALGVVCLLFLSVNQVNAQSSISLEYKVKAAYLLNFTRYVEWSDNLLSKNDTSIVIAILGEDPFGQELEKIVAGRTSHGRSVQVRWLQQPDEIKECLLVFISKKEESRQAEFLAKLGGKPLLTVGESDSFIQLGGMINLVIVDETVRFEVNLEAAEKAGLKISSRLLNLAEVIYPPLKEKK